MDDKLQIILKTAKMLADDNDGSWSGDVHEFATASAYVTPDERLWLSSSDTTAFHEELKGGSFVSEYGYVSALFQNGQRLFVVQEVDTGEV
jgi:hypothetical protein